MLVEHGLAQARGNEIDELIAAQDAGKVGIIEDVLGSGQAQSRACDDDRKALPRMILHADTSASRARERRRRSGRVRRNDRRSLARDWRVVGTWQKALQQMRVLAPTRRRRVRRDGCRCFLG